MKSPNVKALLLMGGQGTRFNSSLPKQFHAIAGKKIYLHTLERFVQSGLFKEIILVCAKKWIELVEEEVKGLPVRVVAGGETRQESSYLGLLACGNQTDVVVIHDAVRPFVSLEILRNNIEGARKHGAVDTCITSADTIVHSQSGDKIDEIPARKEYLRGQTPQSFSYPLILEAHQKAKKEGFSSTDDCSLVIRMGKHVQIVQGDESNIKITTDLDLYLAEQIFRRARLLPGAKTLSLKGKRYAITGGTGDIGSAIRKELEKEGAEVVLLARSSATFPVDLTSSDEAEKTFQKICEKYGPLDGLINSLGHFLMKEVEELHVGEIEKLIQANLTAVIYACKFAKIREGGDILNIASSSYSRGRKGFSIYSATKAAVVNFTQALAEERADLKVNALAPQRALSRLRKAHFPEEDASLLLTPEKIASAAVALLKEKNCTGMIIDVRKE